MKRGKSVSVQTVILQDVSYLKYHEESKKKSYILFRIQNNIGILNETKLKKNQFRPFIYL